MSVGFIDEIDVIDVGVLNYSQCLVMQNQIHDEVVKGIRTPVIILVQHPAVITLGKNSDEAYLKFAQEHYRSRSVDIIRTDRGGEVTAHMPGQLVVYPILPLRRLGLAAKAFVTVLEEAVIRTLANFKLLATRDPDHPGVWIHDKKICAVGVRIKDRVTMHGLAFNITNNLDLFSEIIPCGLSGKGVTSLTAELGELINLPLVVPLFLKELIRLLLPTTTKVNWPSTCNS